MRYFLFTFLIVSIATHAVFADPVNKDRQRSANEVNYTNSRNTNNAEILAQRNIEIAEEVKSIEEIRAELDKQLTRANENKSSAGYAGVYSFIFTIAALIPGPNKPFKKLRLFAAAGGTTAVIGSRIVYQANKEEIQKLSDLLALEDEKLRKEYYKNSAILEAL